MAAYNWVSEYNLEGKVTKSGTELGDGASSRVYLGSWNGTMVAVKELKMYIPRLASSFVKAYEPLFNLSHPNIVQVLGICPQTGLIVLEYCCKSLHDLMIKTLAGLLLQLGDDTPLQLRILALTDTVAGVRFLHNHNIVHGDIKPQNILVCGAAKDEFIFKVTDYACNIISGASHISSKSSSFKQMMTPGYLAPELIGEIDYSRRPTEKSDVYSLAILIYEIFFCKEAWPVVSMKLLSAVQSGHRPVIPDDSPQSITQLIEKCWKPKPPERPNTSEISHQLELYLETIDQDDHAKHNNSCSDAPLTSSLVDGNMPTIDGSVDPSVQSIDECFSMAPCTSLLASELDSSMISESPKGLELDHEIDESIGGSQSQSFCSANIIHPCNSTNRNGHDSNLFVNVSNSGMSYCANSQPSVDFSNSVPAIENVFSSHQSTHDHRYIDMQKVKNVLKITELKQFQIECSTAVMHGHDAIIVQPTGCGKSLCFVIPAICFPGKVSLVIEPAVSVITNQVDNLQSRGIQAVALGRAAGSSKSANYNRVFKVVSKEPIVAFCTPEYLFGTPATSTFIGTKGQFSTVLSKKERFCLITIDEAHKIFDRLFSYCPTFNNLKSTVPHSCNVCNINW